MKLNVKLYDKLVGELVDKDGKIFFRYDKEFLKQGYSISPIKLPLEGRIFSNNEYYHYFQGLMGVFNDSLPDKFGNKIIEQYYKSKGLDINSMSVLQKLIYIGNRSIGALEYEPSEDDIPTNEAIHLKELVESARSVIKGQNILPEIMEASASVGGARTKALIAIHKTTNEMISGDILDENWDNYIIKFDTIEDTPNDYTKIEYIYMKLAKLAGLDVSEVDLINQDNYTHLLVKRFDRVHQEKIHLHSLCGITQIDFNIPKLFSYEKFMIITELLTKDYSMIEEAFKRMVFNIIGRNQDDHLKNFSFLMDKEGKWKLSPAYDVTYAFGAGYTKEHQMTINNKSKNIKYNDILAVAKQFNIKKAKKIIEKIENIFNENFREMAKELDVDKNKIKLIKSNIRTYNGK